MCGSCGKVRDLIVDFTPLRVPMSQREGFVLDSAEVVFRGAVLQA